MRRLRLLPIAAVAAALASLGAPSIFARRPTSVILITVDTLRADRLSAYGYRGATTPAIARLAADGALFSTAYCDIPWTTGSMASVMTGTYGPAHGLEFPWLRLAESQVTLAEILQANGFATAAIVGSFPLDSVYGLDQGFDSYDDDFTTPLFGTDAGTPHGKVEIVLAPDDLAAVARNLAAKMRNDAYRPDADVTAAAVAWLRRRPAGRPFFLWVHYFGPHERFLGGTGDQRRRVIDDYDRDLGATDAAVGGLLATIDALALRDEALVVLHSDHGQSLGEHGVVGHGYDLYEPSVRIPLILRFPPAIAAGTRLDTLARNVDIMPTVLDLLGIRHRLELAGRSLAPALAGWRSLDAPAFMQAALTPAVPVAVPGAGEIFGPTAVAAVRTGAWKYVRTALGAPCVRATAYAMDILGINPARAIGGSPVPDEECAAHRVEALYRVATEGPGLAPEDESLGTELPELATRLRTLVELTATGLEPGEPPRLELTSDQRAKLKSLGYLR